MDRRDFLKKTGAVAAAGLLADLGILEQAAGAAKRTDRQPNIVFTKGGGMWLRQMGELDCEVLGVDWTVNLENARALVGTRQALQGNLDPNVLFAPAGSIAREAIKVLDAFGTPQVLFSGVYDFSQVHNWSTTPDGRFIMIKADPAMARQLRITFNWFDELRETAKTK